MTQDEYAEMLSQAKEQFKQGTPLFGKDGAFHRVLEDFLNSALEGEMDSHLYNTKTSTKSNRCNDKKWDKLSHYFDYTEPIRRIMYTTNIVEGYHCQIRKVTKTKGVFPTDEALFKLIYLEYRKIKKKWTQPLRNWGQTAQQFAIKFGDRFQLL